MPTATSSPRAEATPIPTRAGGTAAAKDATAQLAAERRMIGKGLDVLREDRAQALGVAEQVDVVVDFLRLERDGGGDRMAGVGEAVAPGADLVALAHQRLIDLVGDHHRRDRQ